MDRNFENKETVERQDPLYAPVRNITQIEYYLLSTR